MLVAGIIGREKQMLTAELINSIMTSAGKKTVIVDIHNIRSKESFLDYKEQNKKYIDVLIIKINLQEAGHYAFSFLDFDVIIYNDKADDLREELNLHQKAVTRKIFSLLKEKGTAIVNVDNTELLKILYGMKQYIVTYGFNSKASITTSSIGDTISKEGFMCCLQRTLATSNGSIVEPQEFKVELGAGEPDVYNVLAATTFAIINGVDLNLIN